MAYVRANGIAADLIFRALQHIPGRLVTRTRRQLVSDGEWYHSDVFNEYLRPADIGHRLTSVCQASDAPAISGIDLQRPIGERDFSPRDQRLLNFFHEELGRLIGRSLV